MIVIDFDFQLPQIYDQFGKLFRLLSICAIGHFVALSYAIPFAFIAYFSVHYTADHLK